VLALGLTLPADAERRLLDYLRLLARWSSAYNLTAVRDPREMVTRHLLDSLAVAPHVRGPEVLDIGTGAGLPGIPLALALPDLAFTLLDSNAKKTRFVTQAVAELGLANVRVVNTRVEDFHPPQPFATLIARAFASIPDMLATCAHLCAPGGRILAMKGKLPDDELAALPGPWRVAVAERLAIPGLQATRHLVIITSP
jgi:16S rRNA (guanine527-N7)-methyltransferase